MDIDVLTKKFALYEPMLKEMKRDYDAYVARKSAIEAQPDVIIDDELHAAIHAPLHESDEAVAARAEQAKANDDQAAAAQAELDEANANLQKEADAKAEADRLQAEAEAKRLVAEAAAQAEIDRKAAETAKIDAAAGQNQGHDAGNGSAGGNAPENAGEASQRAPLAELDASGSDGQHKAPEEQPKG